MPRVGRLHIAGGLYHVMGRGLERRWIFEEDADKEWFLNRFGECLNKAKAQCFAWSLMSNHYHFLIRVGSDPLSCVMSSLLGSYGTYYNRRYSRVGYVFQNRFKSILCDENQYLLALVKYIHLNPLKSRMLPDLEALATYRWTGHAGMLGHKKRNWHQVDPVLSLFSHNRTRALYLYQLFMQEVDDGMQEQNLSGGGLIRSYGGWEEVSKLRKRNIQCIGDERILGSDEFVQRVIAQDELKLTKEAHFNRKDWDMKKLAERVCELTGLDFTELSGKARNNKLSKAKALICYLAKEVLGYSLTQIADFLNISQPAVSKWVKKGKQLDTHEKMADEILG